MPRKRRASQTYDMGGGFYISADNRGNWTEYTASQLDEPGGYIVNGRVFRSCYRREADAKIAEWKSQDAAQRAA